MMRARSARGSSSSPMADLAEWGVRARRSVEHLGWRSIAERYLRSWTRSSPSARRGVSGMSPATPTRAHRADRTRDRRRAAVSPVSRTNWSARSPPPARTSSASRWPRPGRPATTAPGRGSAHAWDVVWFSHDRHAPRAALPRRAPGCRLDLPQRRDGRRHLRQPRAPAGGHARPRPLRLADGAQSAAPVHGRA